MIDEQKIMIFANQKALVKILSIGNLDLEVLFSVFTHLVFDMIWNQSVYQFHKQCVINVTLLFSVHLAVVILDQLVNKGLILVKDLVPHVRDVVENCFVLNL